MRSLLAVIWVTLSVVSALAQSQSVQQSGTVTPKHSVMWTRNGVIQDAGTAYEGFLTSLGVTASGDGICQNSDVVTAAGWQRICIGATTSGGGRISVQNFGTASAQPLTFDINGTIVTLPGAGSGNVTGPATSVIGDIALWANTAGTLLLDGGPVAPAAGIYPTRAAAISATISSSIQQVQLQGYASANDGGQGASYGRTSAACNVAYRFQSADGQCWELSNRVVNAGYLGAQGHVVNLVSSVAGTTGSGALTIASGTFTSADVGKLIGVDGFGSSVIRGTQITAGSGYTEGFNNLTVSGGTCSTPIVLQVLVSSGVLLPWNNVINPGVCTAQPSNPVSVTGGGGSGATYNLDWASLSGAISAVTDATHITVSANSSVAKTVTTNVIYGTDETAALNNALAAANNVATTYGASQLALCGSYSISGTSPGGIAVGALMSPHVQISGCPATLYLMGTIGYVGLYLTGPPEFATTTTFAADALKGTKIIQFASTSGFFPGDAIIIRSDEVTPGNTRGYMASIKQIIGTSVTIEPPMPTNVHIAYANSINRATPVSNVMVSNISIDCTAAAGQTVVGMQMLDLANVNVTGFSGNRCNTINSSAVGLYQVLGGWFEGGVSLSGGQGGSDAALFTFITGMTLNYQSIKSDGFGGGLDFGNWNYLNVNVNGANGRAFKLSGSSSNTGDVIVSGAPTGFTGFGFSQGSSYNSFNTATISDSGQCLWSNGTYNTNNTISSLILANCPQNGIAITATDTGWSIGNVRRGPNVAVDIFGTTDQKIQFPFISGTTTLNDCALWTADNQLEEGPCGSLSIGNPVSGGTNGNVLNITAGNLGQVSPTTTVNGQGCTLGSTCTVTAAATSIAVGSTTVTGGTSNCVLIDVATLGCVATANNSVLVTGGGR